MRCGKKVIGYMREKEMIPESTASMRSTFSSAVNSMPMDDNISKNSDVRIVLQDDKSRGIVSEWRC